MPQKQGGFILNPFRFGGAAATLNSLITADSPVYYFRHAEPSGSTMVNAGSVSGNGTYGTISSGPTLGNTALYTGGPTCLYTNASAHGTLIASPLTTLNELTIVTVCRFPTLTGIRGLVSADNNGGTGRRWHFRTNGTSLEFAKIPTTVELKTLAAGLATNTVYMLAVTVTSAGVVTLFVNGVASSTTSFGVINYGGFNSVIEVGRISGGGGAYANAYFSESCIFNTALSNARIAQYAAAAGL